MTPMVERVALPDEVANDPVWSGRHDRGGVFFNPWRDEALRGPLDLLRWKLGGNAMRAAKRASEPPTTVSHALDRFGDLDQSGRVLWLGHAGFLVEIDGVRVVIDPVFGRAGGLVPRLNAPPVRPSQLPEVHAVAVTHGHYDHLDAASLDALARRHPDLLFVVPLGLGRSLPRRCRNVVELDWWHAIELHGLQIALVPAQHWHRRGAFDANKALWGGYVLRGSQSVYHSGDTGWFEGFSRIGAVFDDLALALLPMGAYEPRWFMDPQHMPPSASVQAFQDLGARHMMAMHWGTFDLTDEPYDHGPRVLLPSLVQGAGLDTSRVHVVAPGGSLGLADGAGHGYIDGRR